MPVRRNNIRYAIYTRQSADTPADFSSCAAQFAVCSDFAKETGEPGLTWCGQHFDDQGYSGATLERPGLRRLRKVIDLGGVQRVYAVALDRLSRRLQDMIVLLEECDCAMVHSVTAKGPKRYRYYVCATAMKRGWHTCPSKSIPAAEIERFVVDQIRKAASDPAILAATVRQVRVQSEEAIGKLEQERERLERELKRRGDALRELLAEPDVATASADVLRTREEINALEQRRTEVRDRIIAIGRELVDEKQVVDALKAFDPAWDQLTTRERVRVIQLLVERVEWTYVLRDGKRTKCPVSPTKGGKASSINPATWGTFEQALGACQRCTDLVGVGFVFTKDDPYAGVDLDDCIDAAGHIKPWARVFLEQLDSYTEISPSGTGVKVFVQARKAGSKCREPYADGQVEMYDHGRFFTLTAARLSEYAGDVETRQDAFEAVYDAAIGAATPPAPTKPPPVSSEAAAPTLDDDEILKLAEKSRKSGDKFKALWDGRWNDHFNSRSEADSSVVFTLAYYTKDAARIDRLFRRSGLMRGKWDEQHGDQTYGQLTISKALETVTGQ